MPTYAKDPTEELDYSVDWSEWVPERDTLATATWSVPADLTQPKPPSQDGSKVTVWLAGGEVGQTYPVVCRIVTTAGRKAERTFYVHIEQK